MYWDRTFAASVFASAPGSPLPRRPAVHHRRDQLDGPERLTVQQQSLGGAQAAGEYPQQLVAAVDGEAFTDRAGQDGDLVAQERVLDDEVAATA